MFGACKKKVLKGMEAAATAQTKPIIDAQFYEKVKKAAEDLKENGFAIIPDIYSEQECGDIRERMWSHLSEISGGLLTPERDYKVARATDLPSHKHGIIESWRFNHLSLIREIRRNELIIAVFALLYGTDQLTGSIDRVNFKFPGRTYKSVETWPHVDQHAAKVERISVQSYVTFLDCAANSPGIRFYQGSHKIFGDFFKSKRGDKAGDWNKLTGEERISLPKLCPLVKPTYSAGSLILWDSRTVHDPDDGTDFDDGRFVVYLCFNKLWEKSRDEKFWEKKKAAFLDCRATSHSPLPQKMFSKCPRAYGGITGLYDEIPKEKLGLGAKPDEPVGVEQYLFGFKSYDGKEGKLLGDKDWRQGLALPLLKFVSPYALTTAAVVPDNKKKTKKSEGEDGSSSIVSKKKRTV